MVASIYRVRQPLSAHGGKVNMEYIDTSRTDIPFLIWKRRFYSAVMSSILNSDTCAMGTWSGARC